MANYSPMRLMLRLIALALILIVFLWLRAEGEQAKQSIDENAQITEFYLCHGPAPEGNKPTKPIQSMNVGDVEPLFACGYFQSRTPMYLIFEWLKVEDSKQEFVYQDEDKGRIEPGYFYSKFGLNRYPYLSPGKYVINAWDGHVKILASAQFEVLIEGP